MPRVQDIDLSGRTVSMELVIDPFAWTEPVAHLSERKVCTRVKWISVTSRLYCRVFNPHFGTFGKYSEKFGLRITFVFLHTLLFIAWMKFEFFIIFWLRHVFTMHNICHHQIPKKFYKISFLALWMKFEFFIIFWLKICQSAVCTRVFSPCITFVIRPSDNTYATLHCLNEIRIFYNFLVKTCFHHICHQDTQKIFLLSAQWIVIPAKMIVACSLERRWIAEGTRHRPERQNS